MKWNCHHKNNKTIKPRKSNNCYLSQWKIVLLVLYICRCVPWPVYQVENVNLVNDYRTLKKNFIATIKFKFSNSAYVQLFKAFHTDVYRKNSRTLRTKGSLLFIFSMGRNFMWLWLCPWSKVYLKGDGVLIQNCLRADVSVKMTRNEFNKWITVNSNVWSVRLPYYVQYFIYWWFVYNIHQR